jgi:hypothetical protein
MNYFSVLSRTPLKTSGNALGFITLATPVFYSNALDGPNVSIDEDPSSIFNWLKVSEAFALIEFVSLAIRMYGMNFTLHVTQSVVIEQARDTLIPLLRLIPIKHVIDNCSEPMKAVPDDGSAPISMRIVRVDELVDGLPHIYIRIAPFSDRYMVISSESDKYLTGADVTRLKRSHVYHNMLTRRIEYPNIEWGGFRNRILNCQYSIKSYSGAKLDWVFPDVRLYDHWRAMHICRSLFLTLAEPNPIPTMPLDYYPDTAFLTIDISDLNVKAYPMFFDVMDRCHEQESYTPPTINLSDLDGHFTAQVKVRSNAILESASVVNKILTGPFRTFSVDLVFPISIHTIQFIPCTVTILGYGTGCIRVRLEGKKETANTIPISLTTAR